MKLLNIVLLSLTVIFYAVNCNAQELANIGSAHNDKQIAKNSKQELFLLNKNDVVIAPVEDLNINHIKVIKGADLPAADIELITRIFQVIQSPEEETKTFNDMLKSFPPINIEMIEECDRKLHEMHDDETLNALKNKTK